MTISAMTWEARLAKWLAVCKRMDGFQADFERKSVQLAKHYAAKAGYPKATGYTFFCLHNWTLRGGSESGNVFAQKALAAWNGRFGNYYERKNRVSALAYAKYVKSYKAEDAEAEALLAGIGTR